MDASELGEKCYFGYENGCQGDLRCSACESAAEAPEFEGVLDSPTEAPARPEGVESGVADPELESVEAGFDKCRGKVLELLDACIREMERGRRQELRHGDLTKLRAAVEKL